MTYFFSKFQVGPETSILLSCVSQAIFSCPVMLWRFNWTETSRAEWLFLLLTGLLLGSFNYTALDSVKRIAPVDVISISQLQIVFIISIAHFVLKERMGKYEIFFMIILIIGVFLVCQPEFIFHPSQLSGSLDAIFGYLEALSSAVFASIAFCLVRKLKNVDPFFMSTIQGIIAGILVLAAGGYKMNTPNNGHDWLFTMMAGSAGGLSMLFMTISFCLDDAALVTTVFSSVVIFTLVFQQIFLNIYANYLSIFGIFVTLCGVAFLILKKKVQDYYIQIYSFVRNRYFNV